ncbi:MAG: hypothetical protein HC796_08285 [Synechococcaceae cyanobacterium RL_1_2]|nr:hypothetical protein [Synechococcaceae cyanobacterium RL_1_2]
MYCKKWVDFLFDGADYITFSLTGIIATTDQTSVIAPKFIDLGGSIIDGFMVSMALI